MCHYARISDKFFSVPVFLPSVVFGQWAVAFSSAVATVECIAVTLDSFKVWHYPQSWVPAPLFSRLFREPVISQMLKEMTISKGGGLKEWEVSKYSRTGSDPALSLMIHQRRNPLFFSLSLSFFLFLSLCSCSLSLAASDFRLLRVICNSLCVIITRLLCLAENVN